MNISEQKPAVLPFSNNGKCYPYRMIGDSMESDNERTIKDGESIWIDTQASICEGDIVIASVKERGTMVKQFIPIDPDNIILRSLNKNHADKLIKRSEILSLNRVVGVLQPVILL